MKMPSKVIAIWGSPDSGKTTFSVKAAKLLAGDKRNVLMIHCDDETPVVPTLISSLAAPEKSLGDLLYKTNPTVDTVLQHSFAFGSSGYISLLGYVLGDNAISYPEYTLQSVKNLFGLCKRVPDIDFILVDCSHHTISNILTAYALESADIVFRAGTPDTKSMVYLVSQVQALRDPKFKIHRQIGILNKVRNHSTTLYESAFEKDAARYDFSFCPGLEDQFAEQRLLDSLPGKDGKAFDSAFAAMIREVVLNE